MGFLMLDLASKMILGVAKKRAFLVSEGSGRGRGGDNDNLTKETLGEGLVCCFLVAK